MKESDVISLAKEGTYKGDKVNGRVEETHISWVVLCKRVVFKIKKPVKLSFLDFSTLSKRKQMCYNELRLNARFTDIYQAVVPISRVNAGFIVGGRTGKIVDYAVQSRRLDTAQRMDNVLRRNRVTTDDISSLAKVVSTVHQNCPVINKDFNLRQARKLFNDIGKECAYLYKYAGSVYGSIIRKSIRWNNTFLPKHQKRLKERIINGFKRDVHGDLHCGNIFIYRKPVVFDCIEFNESFRQIDVLYEVAFLCMDLEAYGKSRLGKIFLNEYNRIFKCICEPEDIRIFNYFKCLRANVRAKVHIMGARQADIEVDRTVHMREAKKYLLLMKRYMLA
jgi:aminoglycoside phosphotransferase family enzyme